MFAPSTWRAAWAIVFVAIMGLADALLVAWWRGSVWGVVIAASTITGLIACAAWGAWRSPGARTSRPHRVRG
jgi:hypothetical protein